MAKKEQTLFNLGPWPFGQNTVQPENAALFQVRDPNAMFEEKGLGNLTKAVNVDFTDDGWPKKRVGTDQFVIGTNGLTGFATKDILLYQDGSVVYKVNTTTGATTSLVTGLTQKAVFCEHANRIYGSDGTTHFEIESEVVRAWGLPVPTISLSSGVGATFAAGTYIVQAEFVDARGNRGGTCNPSAITLAATQNITVSVSGHDSRVAGINLYVSQKNADITSYAQTAVATSAPQSVTLAAATTVLDPPVTEFMHGPVSSLKGVASYRAYLLIWKDNAIWRSEAVEPHLFHSEDIYQFPTNVTGVASLKSGFWVGTSSGLWWVTGDEPPWIGIQKTYEPILENSLVLEGWKVPSLQTQDPIAVFVNRYGIVFGLPSGEVIQPTKNRFHITSTYTKASFSYVENNDIPSLIVGLS